MDSVTEHLVWSTLKGLFTCIFDVVTESVRRRLANLRFCEFFVFTLSSLSSAFVTRYCRLGFSVTEHLVCIFDVVRVKRLFTLVLISGFFLDHSY